MELFQGLGPPSLTVNGPALYLDTLTSVLYKATARGSTWTTVTSNNLKRCTTQFDAVTGTTGATLTDIVGLTGFVLDAAGIYAFEINLGTVGTTNSGVKIGLGFTTLTATSIEYQAIGCAAAAVVCSRGTTATTGMTLFGSTTATLAVRITGSIVVNAAGTIAIQAAQNAAHADTTSVFVGSWARFAKIS